MVYTVDDVLYDRDLRGEMLRDRTLYTIFSHLQVVAYRLSGSLRVCTVCSSPVVNNVMYLAVGRVDQRVAHAE